MGSVVGGGAVSNACVVWCPDYDECEHDAKQMSSADPATAAEEWAEREDWMSAEYQIVGGQDAPIVYVRSPDGTVTRFRVTGESVPVYQAVEIEP